MLLHASVCLETEGEIRGGRAGLYQTKRKCLVSLCSPRLPDLGMCPGGKHQGRFWVDEFYLLLTSPRGGAGAGAEGSPVGGV